MRKDLRVFLLSVLVATTASCADPASDNNPPIVTLDVEPILNHTVGEGVIRITAAASDPDGDNVILGIANPPDRATFQDTGELAVFTWDPIASDITKSDEEPRKLVFFAEDVFGAITEKTVRVQILAGNGLPRFTSPAPSVLHRVDKTRDVSFNVEVRDDDSTEVQISMVPDKAPADASFSQNGNFGGAFTWQVSDDAATRRVHGVTFQVDDGQNETQFLKVSILLEKGDRPSGITATPGDPTGCAFEDAVNHAPLTTQSGSDDYEIIASADDKYDQMTLYWADIDVWNSQEAPLESAAMQKEDGVFKGTIPNPLLSGTDSKRFAYSMCAIDDDDPSDEGVICGPSHLFYSFIARSPGTTDCLDDVVGFETFDSSRLFFPLDDSIFFGFNACEGTPDYFEMVVDPNQLLLTFVLGDGLEIEQYDQLRNLESSNTSACPGIYLYQFENTGSEDTSKFLRVQGDHQAYQVISFYEQLDSCTRAEEPNDVLADATDVFGLSDVDGQICPVGDVDLYEIMLATGETVTIDATFSHDDGDLDIELWPPSQSATIGDPLTSVAWGVSLSDNEQIEYTAVESGAHYLRAKSTGPNDYSLSFDIAAMMCVDDDGFVNNHSQQTGANISIGNFTDMKICVGSADWYTLPVLADDDLTIEVVRTDGEIFSLEVNLWLGNSLVGFGVVENDRIRLSRIFPTDDTYHIEVVTDEPATYDLLITDNFL